jgi:predicted murein hydrolase (TIGR00659 family)
MGLAEFYSNPIFGVAITVLVYAVARALHDRQRWLHPLLFTCGVLIGLLLLAHIPYSEYRHGGDIVSFFLGPATIALGVPFYKNARHIGRHLSATLGSVTTGAASGILSAFVFVKFTGGSDAVLRSMLPKSVTTPISIEISRQLGGSPSLTAVFTVLAGLLGSVVGPWILRRCGIRGDIAIGLAMGTSSHGIGTARVVQESELQGGASGLAMALAGVFTSILAMPLKWWFLRH